MKQFYTVFIFTLIALTIQAQNGYEFALVHDGGHAFSITATPNFDAANTDVSDVGFALMLAQKKLSLFMITTSLAYPVSIELNTFLVVSVTILVLGGIASKISSNVVTKGLVSKV